MTYVIDLDYQILQEALELIPDAALSCNEDGNIVSGNREASKLIQCANGEFKNKSLGHYMPVVKEWLEQSGFVEMVGLGVLDSEQSLNTEAGNRKLVWSRSRVLSTPNRAKQYVLLTLRDVTSKSLTERRLREMTVTDELTGMHNRRYLQSVMDFEEERAKRYGFRLACVFIDIDRFKDINDRHGHHVGDEALKKVAQVLKDGCRRIDTVCRWGGDEFVVIGLVKEVAGVRAMLQRLVVDVERAAIRVGDVDLQVTLSAGAAIAKMEGTATAGALLRQADELLRRAKAGGRNRVCVEEIELV